MEVLNEKISIVFVPHLTTSNRKERKKSSIEFTSSRVHLTGSTMYFLLNYNDRPLCVLDSMIGSDWSFHSTGYVWRRPLYRLGDSMVDGIDFDEVTLTENVSYCVLVVNWHYSLYYFHRALLLCALLAFHLNFIPKDILDLNDTIWIRSSAGIRQLRYVYMCTIMRAPSERRELVDRLNENENMLLMSPPHFFFFLCVLLIVTIVQCHRESVCGKIG